MVINDVQNIFTLSLLGKEERWIWFYSDENLTDSFWGPNYPNTSIENTDDCALMVSQLGTFWWQDSSCLTATVQNKRIAPICQHERIAHITSTTLPPSTTMQPCQEGWTEFRGHCFLFSGSGAIANWTSAEDICVQKGAHLASTHSWDEQVFVNSISSSGTWLGATDIVEEVM